MVFEMSMIMMTNMITLCHDCTIVRICICSITTYNTACLLVVSLSLCRCDGICARVYMTTEQCIMQCKIAVNDLSIVVVCSCVVCCGVAACWSELLRPSPPAIALRWFWFGAYSPVERPVTHFIFYRHITVV